MFEIIIVLFLSKSERYLLIFLMKNKVLGDLISTTSLQ